MGALVMLMADGAPPGTTDPGRRSFRWRGLLAELRRNPFVVRFLLPPLAWKFSQRAIIGLVMQPVDNSITVRPAKKRLGRGWRLSSGPGHGTPSPRWIPTGHRTMRILGGILSARTGMATATGAPVTDLVDIPMTAHFIGGCAIGSTPERGVIDPYQRVWGYPTLHVVDGSALSANLGVNPSLSITAMSERAMSLWPRKGEPDPRPTQAQGYARLEPVPALREAVPASVRERWRLDLRPVDAQPVDLLAGGSRRADPVPAVVPSNGAAADH
jgi:cholesterol oxidase